MSTVIPAPAEEVAVYERYYEARRRRLKAHQKRTRLAFLRRNLDLLVQDGLITPSEAKRIRARIEKRA